MALTIHLKVLSEDKFLQQLFINCGHVELDPSTKQKYLKGISRIITGWSNIARSQENLELCTELSFPLSNCVPDSHSSVL